MAEELGRKSEKEWKSVHWKLMRANGTDSSLENIKFG